MIEAKIRGRFTGVINASTGEVVAPGSPGVENVTISNMPPGRTRMLDPDSILAFGDPAFGDPDLREPIPDGVTEYPSYFWAYGNGFAPVTPNPITLGEPFSLQIIDMDDLGSENLMDFGGMRLEVELMIDDDPEDPDNALEPLIADFDFELDYIPGVQGADGANSRIRTAPGFFEPTLSENGQYELFPFGVAKDQSFSDPDPDPIFDTEFDLTGFNTYEIYATLLENPDFVPPSNNSPVAMDLERAVPRNEEIVIPLAEFASDRDGDELMVEILSGPEEAEFSDGALRYDPPDDTALKTAITYRVTDASGGSDDGTLDLTIGPDVQITGPITIERVVGGVTGPDLSWTEGETIRLSVDVVNAGGETTVGDVFPYFELRSLNEEDDEIDPFLDLLTVEAELGLDDGGQPDEDLTEIRSIAPGEAVTLSTSVEVSESLASLGVKYYYVTTFIIPIEFVQEGAEERSFYEADITDNTLPKNFSSRSFSELTNGVPRITLSRFEPVDLDDVLEAILTDDLADLFTASKPRGLRVESTADTTTTVAYNLAADETTQALRTESATLTVDEPQGGGIPPVQRLLGPDEVIEITDPETGLTDTLVSVERVSFLDGVLVFDLPGDDVPFVYRVYDAAFARRPDEAGLRFWTDQVASGAVDTGALAQFFVDSPEFDTLFPSSSDEEFIEALYLNALRRPPDPGGEAFWLEVFASGAQTRADMLEVFADSPENIERNADNYDDGVWVT